mgnify:CR=1 FL=1
MSQVGPSPNQAIGKRSARSERGGKAGLFGGAGVGKTVLITELIHNVVGGHDDPAITSVQAVYVPADDFTDPSAVHTPLSTLSATMELSRKCASEGLYLAIAPLKSTSEMMLPGVVVGRSVSRVGGKTQLPAYRVVAGDLRLTYSQFEELERFARFSSQLDEDTRATLHRGRLIREILKQRQFHPLTLSQQIASLVAVTSGGFDALSPQQCNFLTL